MAQQDLLKLQLQARENAVELNDYLKDLNSWQSEIKEKDKTFREMKPSSQVCDVYVVTTVLYFRKINLFRK